MATIVTRSGKGSPLTHAEVDANFTNLNTDKLELSGGTMTGNLSFGDNDKAIFGAGSDLQIYHDGSNSIISDQGTGHIKIYANDFRVTNAANTEQMITANQDGAVTLYYDSVDKLATTSTGVDITGTLTSDGLTNSGTSQFDGAISLGVAGASNAYINTPSGIFVNIDSDNNQTDRFFDIRRNSTDGTGPLIFKAEESGDISFYEDTGTTAKFFWDASAESLGIGTSSPASALHVSGSGAEEIRITRTGGAGRTYSTSVGGSLEYNIRDENAGVNRLSISTAGNVGIGTSSPTDFTGGRVTLEVYDTVGSYILSSDGTTVSRMGTEGGVGYLGTRTNHPLAITTNNAEHMRIDSSGNVGIGTSSPSSKLHINTGSYGEALRFQASSETSGYYTVGMATGAGLAFSRDGTERMRIDSSGNVGIGTSSPDTALNVVSSSTQAKFEGSDQGNIVIEKSGTDGFAIFSNAAGTLAFYDNNTGTERMRISSGNVGIGTSSPSRKLEVSAAGDILQITGTGSNAFARFTDNDASSDFSIGADDGSGAGAGTFMIYDRNNTAYRMIINSSGNVGIGTVSPTGKLTVDGGSIHLGNNGEGVIFGSDTNTNNLIFGNAASNFIGLQTNSTERMRIDSSGNVGIGTSSPSEKLQIQNGNILLETTSFDQNVGYYLHSTENTAEGGGMVYDENRETVVIGSRFPASGAIAFHTAMGDGDITDDTYRRMLIDASGNVGIGTSSPSSYYGTNLVVSSPTENGITIAAQATNNTNYLNFADGTSGDARYRGWIGYSHSADRLTIGTAASERMRIDSSGNVGIGTSSPFSRLHVQGEAGNDTAIFRNGSDAGNGISIQRTDGTEVGSINWASSSTSFNTTSDHRLKENVVDLTGATVRLKQLAPKRFNFIADPDDTTVDGFLAHEVQSVVPEAITGTHNEVDADGNPVYQGIDQSKLVPLLVATIKELEARITALEAN